MTSRKVAISVHSIDDDLDADFVGLLLAALRVPSNDEELAALDCLLDDPIVIELDTGESAP
ncbi:hypothetical protein [Azospirillum sp. BE72]|uniref:hypothetical protein n=1 Tax=Azospirillum sp. BE72 TaxID=2817776 RepID=UPI0028618E53|nr:hypothetical protein [Azospirillum sp. BE72]MDR6772685.1 hypothetical protein [Azospirillum sp. BE72]